MRDYQPSTWRSLGVTAGLGDAKTPDGLLGGSEIWCVGVTLPEEGGLTRGEINVSQPTRGDSMD